MNWGPEISPRTDGFTAPARFRLSLGESRKGRSDGKRAIDGQKHRKKDAGVESRD